MGIVATHAAKLIMGFNVSGQAPSLKDNECTANPDTGPLRFGSTESARRRCFLFRCVRQTQLLQRRLEARIVADRIKRGQA